MIYQRQASFQEAVREALTVNYCNFSGRASRSQYWWFALFIFIIGCILGVITAIWTNFGTVLAYIVEIALILPGLGLSVRRLHDIDKSGWWVLLGFIPLIGSIILLIWFCKDSQMTPNQYGEVPLLTQNNY